MKKEKKQNKVNPKIKKWIGYSLFLILFGTSAIVNIAYLPKYFTLKNHQDTTQEQVLNVNVCAYDENDKTLISIHYQTILATLGQLMAKSPDTYILKKFSLGNFLYGIKYKEDGEIKIKQPENIYQAYWNIRYLENGQEKDAPVGIDDFYIFNNQEIILRYVIT